MRVTLARWGVGTEAHCYLGVVAGVFYVWRLGVTLRLSPGWPALRVESWPDGVHMLRAWPLIFVWVGEG